MIHRITFGLAALLFGALVLRLARRDRLLSTAAAWWLGGAFLLLVSGAAPELFRSAAAVFGIELLPSAPLFLAIAFLALRGLFVDMDRTRRELCLRRLVQRHAHLELRVREVAQALAAHGMPLPERGDMTEDLEGTGGGASPPDR
ncbi:DUF2304 domain-containing protein [Humidesulfovibrio idahonensis]